MSSPIQISDDDDSFSLIDIPDAKEQTDSEDAEILLTSDDEFECQLPSVNLNDKRSAVIKKLFPSTAPKGSRPVDNNTKVHVSPNVSIVSESKKLGIEMPIAGLKVNLPLKPYGSQIALMFKVCVLYLHIQRDFLINIKKF